MTKPKPQIRADEELVMSALCRTYGGTWIDGRIHQTLIWCMATTTKSLSKFLPLCNTCTTATELSRAKALTTPP